MAEMLASQRGICCAASLCFSASVVQTKDRGFVFCIFLSYIQTKINMLLNSKSLICIKHYILGFENTSTLINFQCSTESVTHSHCDSALSYYIRSEIRLIQQWTWVLVSWMMYWFLSHLQTLLLCFLSHTEWMKWSVYVKLKQSRPGNEQLFPSWAENRLILWTGIFKPLNYWMMLTKDYL